MSVTVTVSVRFVVLCCLPQFKLCEELVELYEWLNDVFTVRGICPAQAVLPDHCTEIVQVAGERLGERPHACALYLSV